jgi:hypothetical protein
MLCAAYTPGIGPLRGEDRGLITQAGLTHRPLRGTEKAGVSLLSTFIPTVSTGWAAAYLKNSVELGRVGIHRDAMTAAARWIMAAKLWSVLSLRMAIRLNSFSLQKKFSIK